MKNLFNKIKTYIVAHKTRSIILLIIILILGYWAYGKLHNTGGVTQYNLSAAAKGTVIASIGGSGQVSALSQIDLKPIVSGTITYVSVKPGDQVWSGQNLFSLDSTDAKKTVRDAEISLASAQLALDKLKIQNSNDNLNANLVKVYDDGFSNVSSTLLNNLVPITDRLENTLNIANLSDNSARNSGNTALDYRNQTEALYYQVKDALNKNQIDFRKLNRNSAKGDIENIINETYATTKILADALKSTKNFVDYLAEDTGRSSDFTSTQNTLSTDIVTINGDLSSLLSNQSNIKSSKDSLPNADLDLQSSELAVQQKENALADAKDNLSKYYILAPFNGSIASVPVNVGDEASSGTTLATIITTKELATITLNEVDVAKIKLGEKATLTFDAIPDLTIAGQVAEIDSLGAVSQGVVNYTVKISFDTQDKRVMSGMSVEATIITDMAQDVVVVPNSAIKAAKDGTSYVQMFDTSVVGAVAGTQNFISLIPPQQITVQTGLVDNTSTQIISGLKEGDVIVIKTIAGTTTKTTTPSILNAVGGSANKGGGGRMGM